MLVKHMRDDFGVPFGTIVAVDCDRIGVSICNTKDHFNKSLGAKIAEGRALCGSYSKIPNQMVVYNNRMTPLCDVVAVEMCHMMNRASRYFKQ